MRPPEVRNAFLEFFKSKDHKIVPGTPVIPYGDPTLLFTNAGMNQFKDVFLGTGTRSYKRAANTQKCIRVSGKHNDLESVGRDGYHHTFFEMLGNWSFGDYFKVEAIKWAWEFMVEICGIPPEKLYATVFAGDRENFLEPDEEAEKIWKNETGINPDHVLQFGKKDNFWEMGFVGPCGPCSEIHIDLGKFACDNASHNKDGSDCAVNGDCSRFLEVWNLVFIQYESLQDGTLKKLPSKHVDTGMGLERLSEIMRIKEKLIKGDSFDFSNYNTELFTPIFDRLREITGIQYSPRMDARELTAYRVIADHIRALSIAIADGVMPDKKSRGSVLRSLLRRSSRFGRQVLGIEEPFLFKLVEPVTEIYLEVFPEVYERKKHIELVIEAEERNFSRTIQRGINRFISLIEKTRETNPHSKVLDGFEAYRLYHQDGFPKDLIEQMAAEEGYKIDQRQWEEAQEAHKKASESEAMNFKFDLEEIKGISPTQFVGYWEQGKAPDDGTETQARILKIIENRAVILDRTVFYAESGGQVGDRGMILGDGFKFVVNDTGRIGDIIIHYGEIEEANLDKLPQEVIAKVDKNHRWNTAANHSSTHILQWALRSVLGQHVVQQGSFVGPDYFRFDFTHPEHISSEDLQKIERLVNEKIYEDHRLQISIHPLEEAIKMGAIALFGEKYGEMVRMIQIGDFSKELCGGTHLKATGQAGYFKILSESAVQSGVRRIIAVTRMKAIEMAQKESGMIKELSKLLGCHFEDILPRIDSLIKQLKEEKRRSESLTGRNQNDFNLLTESVKKEAIKIGGMELVITEKFLELDKTIIGKLADKLVESGIAGLLAGKQNHNIIITIFAPRSIVNERGIDCGRILSEAASYIGRRAGGRPNFAQTGWKESENVDFLKFVQKVKELFVARLNSQSHSN